MSQINTFSGLQQQSKRSYGAAGFSLPAVKPPKISVPKIAPPPNTKAAAQLINQISKTKMPSLPKGMPSLPKVSLPSLTKTGKKKTTQEPPEVLSLFEQFILAIKKFLNMKL